ncbi:CCA1, partial [Symbiodinium pilosum]
PALPRAFFSKQDSSLRRTASSGGHKTAATTGLSGPARVCMATMAAVATERLRVRHGEELAEEYICRIPKTDAEILKFFLCFLADRGLQDVPVFINGGYVRDLLLGKEPDDLDLTLCLRDCAPE